MTASDERHIDDATEHKNKAIFEDGVALRRLLDPAKLAEEKQHDRAASLSGGRIAATLDKLGDVYSVEFWFSNTLPHKSRPVTGYLFSRGAAGPEGTPGDDLGISGTSAVDTVPSGRLFFYNGDASKLLAGKTELAIDTWYHIVLVRDGNHIAVYLNGNAEPEISGELARGYPDGVKQLFLGGRNDNFANLQGNLAEAAIYDRALIGQDAKRHYKGVETHP